MCHSFSLSLHANAAKSRGQTCISSFRGSVYSTPGMEQLNFYRYETDCTP